MKPIKYFSEIIIEPSAGKTKNFFEDLTEKEISEKIHSFLTGISDPARRDFFNVNSYSLEECEWLVEAALNYSYDELDKEVSDYFSFKDSIDLSTYSQTVFTESDCQDFYLYFNNIVLNHKNSDSLFVCRLIDVSVNNNYLIAEIVYGPYVPSQRGISDPDFLSGESYYAYLPYYVYPNPMPTPAPGNDNAAIHVESKLRLRKGILVLPAGSYWTGVTGWEPGGGWVSPITPYYGQVCGGNDLKLWGTPGLEAVYKGQTENTYFDYNYLNFILSEANYRISMQSYPPGKVVSHIEYKVVHAGEILNSSGATPCLGSYEFFTYFRWRYGTLVMDR